MAGKLRLGVDVGGTFTDVVAIDAATRKVVASVKVPTTHRAAEGVAAGIIEGIQTLFARYAIDPSQVAFIAHSTTQATNALLEGDVAHVGVLGLLNGLAPLARMQMQFSRLQLAPGAAFAPEFSFVKASDEASIGKAIDGFKNRGAGAVAVTQAFSVDKPQREDEAVAFARESGLFATSGHDVSSLYGLRARTRTAAINAAILPKMVKTARMTDAAVHQAGISAPLMVMRSDGGVMDAREMERRPILTLLSGPAAGVAGALLHENVTDGIFIEVGGTSSDCSAIRAGMPQMRAARVGGQRMMLRTLDVRTLGIAGGSLIRIDDSRIIDVGPRSAHIAGLEYSSFVAPDVLRGARVETIRPEAHDTDDYACLVALDGTRIALTPTCAANLLGYVPERAFARGSATSARAAFEILAQHLGRNSEELARELLDIATGKLIAAIETLAAEYELDPHTIVAVGGGGGAAALVPYATKRIGIEFRLARDAEVISPIGVALALVREVVERTIVNPTPEDIVRVRREAQEAVIAAGASPDGVQVAIEIDGQRNLVRATASGASEMVQVAALSDITEAERLAAAARFLRTDPASVTCVAKTQALAVFAHADNVRVLDKTGVARLALRNASVVQTTVARAPEAVPAAIEAATAFGDLGRALPQIFLLHGARIADFSGLLSADQATALVAEEIAGLDANVPIIIVTASRPA